jgi:hypothetical protein
MMSNIRLQDGQLARALEPLDAILKTIKEPGVGFFLPEIHRLRAECLLRMDPANFDLAIREFELAIGRQSNSKRACFGCVPPSVFRVLWPRGVGRRTASHSFRRSSSLSAVTTSPKNSLRPGKSFPRVSYNRSWLAPIPLLAPLRHADRIEKCPLSGATRKTFAHTEFFSV